MAPEPLQKNSTPARSHVPPEDIRAQLQRVLDSPEFLASNGRREFLRFVVEEALAGRGRDLKGFTIATEVFGRGNDFDGANDPIVRVQAGRLRRELERYYLVAGVNDPIRIDIPKGRYIPFFIEQPDSRVATAAAAPAAATAPVSSPMPSIAVLPLTDLSADRNQAYFIDGLLEEITVELGRYKDVVAVPYDSGLSGTEPPRDTRRLAAHLRPRFLLGGTLRKDETTTKVALHLRDVATGGEIWSEVYKERLQAGAIIATQERIARDVVGTVASELGVVSQRLARESRRKPPSELTTYEALLRYHHYMRSMSPETYVGALAALQAAVEREPGYGPAWSALANLFNHAWVRDVPGFDRPLETATEYAKRGIALDPGNQLSRTIMAYSHQLNGHHEAALVEADAALALNPESIYYGGKIGYILVMAGDFGRGRRLLDRAIEMNPCHPRWLHQACWADDYHNGDYEASYQHAVLSEPRAGFWNLALLIASLGQLERPSEAKSYVEELRAQKSDFEAAARELIVRACKVEGFAEKVLEGLKKGGLDVAAS